MTEHCIVAVQPPRLTWHVSWGRRLRSLISLPVHAPPENTLHCTTTSAFSTLGSIVHSVHTMYTLFMSELVHCSESILPSVLLGQGPLCCSKMAQFSLWRMIISTDAILQKSTSCEKRKFTIF